MSPAPRWRAERLLRRFRPGLDGDPLPPPRALGEGLWIVERRLRFGGGMTLRTNVTVIALPEGGVALHAPVRVDPGLRRFVEERGGVRAIVAPNPFHYVFLAEVQDALPEASLFLAPGLAERIPDLPSGEMLGRASPAWEGSVDEILVGPTRDFGEVVLLHRPSRTLVLTDLAFRLGERGLQRTLWRLTGMPRRFGPSRTTRKLLLCDPEAARPALRVVAGWPFEQIAMTHGEPVTRDARDSFARGFAAYL